ncbi:MAG TPA: hypothetical protein VGB85_04245 [Nannocystis sp.]|jgi:hypothetical protein
MTDPRSTSHSFTLLFTGLVLAACGAPADATGGSDTSSSSATTDAPDPTTGEAGDTSSSGEGGDPGEAQCQADLQDCPDDFKCVLRRGAADWEFVCLPVQGEHAAGEACHHDGVIAGTDDCDQSSWCIGAFDTTGNAWDGLCYPLCVGMTCEAEQRCVGIGALPVCAPTCDPLVGGDCGSDEACIYRPPEGFVCFPTGSDGAAIGEPCETAVSCDAGLHCAQKVAGCAPEDFCCTDYCDTGSASNTCAQQAAGASCATIGATDPTQAHVGACVVQD